MTLTQLLIYIAIAAIILTLADKFLFDRVKNYIVSYLQNFAGSLFIFSGAVKIVDPLGTAFKMEDYFEQFEYTFAETWMSFIAPVFPFLSEYSVIFSMITIVFEIVLGYMLVVGSKPKFTSWAFLVLVVFFTALTGFTFLTGFVPTDANFFNFSAWQEFNELNMRVTDCGCFGDFIILDPRVSFMKDVFLLIPAIFFILRFKDFHQLFTPVIRNIGLGVLLFASIIYGISNFMWDLPDFDFRPFSEGADLQAVKAAEQEASANVEILSFELKNKETGELTIVPYDQYMKEYQTNYPKEKFTVVNTNMTEPSMKISKVSEFSYFDEDGNNIGSDLFSKEGVTFIAISYEPKGESVTTTETVKDSIIEDVRLVRENKGTGEVDTIDAKKFKGFDTREENVTRIEFKDSYRNAYMDKVNPLFEKVQADGHDAIALQGSISFDQIDAMKEDLKIEYPVYQADKILLKTIIRSNPGILILNDGVVMAKYHISQLPDYKTIKKNVNLD